MRMVISQRRWYNVRNLIQTAGTWKGRDFMNKFEETKFYEMLKKHDKCKAKKTVLWILAVVGAVAAIAGIAYAVYRFVTPKYLEEFEEDFDDDFEDEFFEDEEL